jgi:hypothetical protein
MSKFASKYPLLVAAMALAFGESNAAIEYDEENNAATLSSEQLGAINKQMANQSQQLVDANTAFEKQQTAHAEFIAALQADNDALTAKVAALEAGTAAKQSTGAKTDGDAEVENEEAADEVKQFSKINNYLNTTL